MVQKVKDEPQYNRTPEEFKRVRAGLTTEQAEGLYETVGFNELPVVEVSLVYLFFVQFTGLMPYMLEVACILSLATEDWLDFAIIFLIVLCNGLLGFTEELKAAASLAELTAKMEQKVAVLRDGQAETLLTRLLVPGDVILLTGGTQVPADVEWLEGDVLSVDTAALTGEPIPRKYPGQHGKLVLCGSVIQGGEAYCLVEKTGANTEVGGAQVDIMNDKTETKVSVFESRVLAAVKVLITVAIVDVIIIFLVQGFARNELKNDAKTLILTCLSIIIGSVPVALPLVLQVTMALGAGKMARDYASVVTSLPALQDISSMTVLCSDKTGTLTTARITIISEKVWTNPLAKFTVADVCMFGVLGSNRDKKEDAIDRSVVEYFDKVATAEMRAAVKEYTKTRNVGFSPVYKRVVWEYSHPTKGKITISKGLVNKVIDTEAGTPDDAEDQWKVEHWEKLAPMAAAADVEFATVGYKTLGVSVKINDDPWRFVGILPMLDPPRHDTAETIKALINAGINVKMCTGDHLNIAKETARLIGLGTDIHRGEEVRDTNPNRVDMIMKADGFAQVLPKDKRDVVMVLRNELKQVIGMTGDGVNDAPALSAAQCGVAVDDATDAAKNAAAIILTAPGLSAIYDAVVESRKIFRKLKSYVIYRFAATIQLVWVLTVMIFASDCPIESLMVILLALFNDLSLLPIAYDTQQASKSPENPDVNKILVLSAAIGIIQTGLSLFWGYVMMTSGILSNQDYGFGTCNLTTQSVMWVQIFISAEFVIFSTRCSELAIFSKPPSQMLFWSVIIFCIIVSVMATGGSCDTFGCVPSRDVAVIWAYNICAFMILDYLKVQMLKMYDEDTRVLEDWIRTPEGGSGDVEAPGVQKAGIETDPVRRESLAGRMHGGPNADAVQAQARASNASRTPNSKRPSAAGLRASLLQNGDFLDQETGERSFSFDPSRHSSANHRTQTGHSDLRRSITGTDLRPNVPGSNLRR